MYYTNTDSPDAPTTRGNKFALAFMGHNRIREGYEITLYITTQQQESKFTIETLIPGLDGFTKTRESEIYTRAGTARSGQFTSILLQANNDSAIVTVQGNGDEDTVDQRKGFFIKTDNVTDELTIYSQNTVSGDTYATDAFMALSCQEFPSRIYEYFIFSANVQPDNNLNQLLITPCENDTMISTVRTSQKQIHPAWVLSEFNVTEPGGETTYKKSFNRFDTLTLGNQLDMTGTIITSDKPLAVFAGNPGTIRVSQFSERDFFEAGIDVSLMVEQIPPHPTYGDTFLLVPFPPGDTMYSSVVYRIGSIRDNTLVEINCDCRTRPVLGNRVGITYSNDQTHTTVINRGEYIECESFEETTFCSMRSLSMQPVTVMSYPIVTNSTFLFLHTPGLYFARLFMLMSTMVYIPPVSSYLSQYSFTSFIGTRDLQLFHATEDLQLLDLLVNGSKLPINSHPFKCTGCGGSISECGRGGSSFLSGFGNYYTISSHDTEFWAYIYTCTPNEHRFFPSFSSDPIILEVCAPSSYPLPFKQEPIGCEFSCCYI